MTFTAEGEADPVDDLRAQAGAWAAAGYAALPVATDGSKAPGLPAWKQYQTRHPTRAEHDQWFAPGRTDGIGILCGTVSGNLEMFELEGRAVADGLADQLAALMADNGHADLWRTLLGGYFETTPSGGWHLLYRVHGPARPNTSLARRPGPDGHLEVLAETRGEGGFTVTAPSHGRTHPTGLPWTLVNGTPHTIPVISEDDRDALHAIATLLDQTPPVTQPATLRPAPGTGTGLRPGDAYEQAATWDDLLAPLGWTRLHPIGPGWAWRRPGKTRGTSATTGTSGDGADRLYVFSTSTPFDPERPYSKFAAYALLHHHGDYSAAAADLRSQGHGAPPTRPALTAVPAAAPDADGTIPPQPRAGTLTRPRPADNHTLEHSEDGHAVALADHYGHAIRYCPQRSRWLHWEGHRWEWQPRSGGHVREHAKTVARAMPDSDREQVAHKRRSLSAAGTSACLSLAATDPRLTVHVNQLDADPWALNTPGGILDLRTGTLSPPDPAALHTRTATTTPDPGANPGAWHAFLADTFGDDTALTGYLRRLIGYSAVGLVREHVLPFGVGGGQNGKSALMETVAGVLGDYATSAPSGFLMASMHAAHETEIARLAGARFVICSEVNDGDRFDEAKVKLLTGGDRLTARFMRDDHFTFTPTHHLWLVGNSRPAVRSGGLSFWRRVRLIEFTRTVPDDKRIDGLAATLAADHGPAVLAWIAAGAADYHRRGLAEPASVKAATDGYALDSDTVARFLDDGARIGGGDLVKTPVAAVRSAYEAWCHAEGEAPVSAKAFGIALRTRFGIDTAKGTKGVRHYVGMSLLDAGNAPPADGAGDFWGTR